MSRRSEFFIVAPVLVIAALAAAVSAFLYHGKFADILAGIEQHRYTGAASRAQAKIEAALNLGVPLAGMDTAAAIVERERATLPEIAALAVYSAEGILLYSSGQSPWQGRVPAELLKRDSWQAAGANWRAAGVKLSSGFSSYVGGVAVVWPTAASERLRSRIAGELALAALIAAGGTAAFGAAGVLMRRRRGKEHLSDASSGPPRYAIRPIVLYLLAVVLTAQVGLAVYASRTISQALTPELGRNAETVAVSLAAAVDRALAAGIPLDRIEGTESYFARAREHYPSVAFAALAGADGRVIFAEGLPATAVAPLLASATSTTVHGATSWLDVAASQPRVHLMIGVALRGQGSSPGTLYLGVRQQFLDDSLETIRLDILVVLGVSLVLLGEVLRFVMAAPREASPPAGTVAPPAAAVVGRLAPVRLLAFLFMFGEQLSRPFLPMFAQGLLHGEAMPDFWAGLPITAFLVTVALTMLLASRAERFGSRRVFLAGAVAAVAGLAGSALSFGIADFIVWRSVTAVGYALMFLACQGRVVESTTESDRAAGFAVFVGAIMVSELCAPGIGGILADRLGPRAVFAIGAAIMALAGIIAAGVLDSRPGVAPAPPPPLWSALRNLRFVLLLVTAVVPTKLALTSFMFFAVPVALAKLGSDPAEIGRIAMLYAVPSLLSAAAFARFADRHRVNGLMIGSGLMLTGAGFLPVVFFPGKEAIAAGVVALGIGQAMSISPQLALATELCRDTVARHGGGSMLGVYRLVERGGAALGALIAASLAAWLGPVETLGVMGAGLFACGVAFGVAFLVLGTHAADDALAALRLKPQAVP